MAIIAFTPYNDEDSCLRCNKYIADGHGDAEVRINRYISDGHGGHTQCQGHLCPADPVLATEYMQLLRENYERQHPPRADTKKHPLTHVQFYISPTEEDNVPAAERMEMMQELIDRTVLKDFANLYIPHDNTPNKHGHMSVCPFSVPDEKGKVRKLCLNNNLLYDLRRKMDYICVEHGYSIVENPKLWGDKEYYTWFQEVKASGAVTVHPPREEDLVYYRKEAKLLQDYARSKQKQVEEETRRKTLIEEFSVDANKANEEYIYMHPYLHDPLCPERVFQIRRYGADGYRPHALELDMIALSVWAMSAEQKLETSDINESSPLRKSLRELSAKAYRTKQLIHSLDIRTLEELVLHTKECGRDIHELKADIKYQNSLLADMDDMKRQVDRWEYLNDMEAYGYLQEHGCLTPDDISAFQLQYRRILERKEDHEKLLGERSTEYRHLKEAESLLRPAEHQALWEEYVKTVYTKQANRLLYDKRMSKEEFYRQMVACGRAMGISEDDIASMVGQISSTAKVWPLYWELLRRAREKTEREKDIKDNIQKTIAAYYEEIREIRRAQHSYFIIGPITFLFCLVSMIEDEIQINAIEAQIEELKILAQIEALYAREARHSRMIRMRRAKEEYDAEVKNAEENAIRMARERFYIHAVEILDRADIKDTIKAMSFEDKLEEAIQRELGMTEFAATLEREERQWTKGRTSPEL